jgi:nitrate reductase delta subunit
MAKTFRALSALLTYPSCELQQGSDEIRAVVEDEGLVSAPVRRLLERLIEEIATGDLYDLQERYVLLFDRTRSLSLHLFEHVHGESRDRGQAMIDLNNLYENHGLAIGARELPDFLPLFLEFLSTRPVPEARRLLAQPAHILAAAAERLRKRCSAYEAVFRALLELADGEPEGEAVKTLLQAPDLDPEDPAILDAAWEEEPVTFGPGAVADCKEGLIARIRAAKRPADSAADPGASHA